MTSLKRPPHNQSLSTTANISSKVFILSGKGKCHKIVREIYLRRDIPCSSKLCPPCTFNAPTDANGKVLSFVLSEHPAGTTTYPNGHYLIPDTNIFLSCMDIIEHETAFYDVIVLQTVLEEVRNKSLPLYNRLRALAKSDEKRFYVFHNEFRQETYIKRLQGETINDSNDRAIRRACSWYKSHLESSLAESEKKPPEIVMLSEDRGNLKKAKEEGIVCCTIREYVQGLPNSDQLLDMISAAWGSQDSKPSQGEMLYPDYYSVSKVLTGLKAGTLHQGTFNVSVYNFLEGSVSTTTFGKGLLVLGRENINRAVQGDQVVVEILPKDQWKQPSTKIVDEETLTKNDNPEFDAPEAIETEQERKALVEEVKKSQELSLESRPQPTGRIVGIVKRNWRCYVGHIDPSSVSSGRGRGQQTVFLLPMDKRIPKVRIRTRQASSLLGKRIVVSIDTWDRASRYPVGHFIRSLGEVETREAETEALLLEYNVQYRPFPKAVLDCLPREGHDWKIPQNPQDPLWKGRKDYRDLLICSIDPPGCQDIDDALHARVLSNGNYEVGVHIADVTHFVKPNNPMDDEAAARGTTVYLVDKRIDMLPILLGTDLCSLKPYVDRFAFSVIWELDQDAHILSTTFSKSAIRSREAFTYEQAQIRINDSSYQDDLTKGMRFLLMLSKKLKQRRMDAGALNLASPEVKVHVESETSDPVDIETKKLQETNSLVEEFMLLANVTVARRIFQTFPQTALLRRHGTPPRTSFAELQKQLDVRKGMNLRIETSHELADSLDTCVDPKEPFFNTLVRILATRCMLAAEYFYSGSQAYPEYLHYGLAEEIYTHFTSPIRRYADVVVHRQLAAAIGYEQVDNTLHSQGKLEAVCKNLNVRHRNAQFAGRASIEYYVGQVLKNQETEEEGFVMRIFSNGFVVFVPRFGIEAVIRAQELDGAQDQGVVYDAEKYVLTIDRGNEGKLKWNIGLFDKVIVRVKNMKEESTGKRKIKFDLVAVGGKIHL